MRTSKEEIGNQKAIPAMTEIIWTTRCERKNIMRRDKIPVL